jgi:hypothetical protein
MFHQKQWSMQYLIQRLFDKILSIALTAAALVVMLAVVADLPPG